MSMREGALRFVPEFAITPLGAMDVRHFAFSPEMPVAVAVGAPILRALPRGAVVLRGGVMTR